MAFLTVLAVLTLAASATRSRAWAAAAARLRAAARRTAWAALPLGIVALAFLAYPGGLTAPLAGLAAFVYVVTPTPAARVVRCG